MTLPMNALPALPTRFSMPLSSQTGALLLSLCAAMGIGISASAQNCGGPIWQSGGAGGGEAGVAWGVDKAVRAFTMWNHDGDPKTPDVLVVGGALKAAGNTPANSIALWDGKAWHALGSGMNGPVHALRVFNGQLIAGGAFTQADAVFASRIARWNGAQWQAMGSGFSGGSSVAVHALGEYQGQLIAGGAFTTASGASANRIARWNGTSWQPLGEGMTSTVRALIEFEGNLVAGGSFDAAGEVVAQKIAKWNGTEWSDFGGGFSQFAAEITSLALYGGVLIAGGGYGLDEEFPILSRWHFGTWTPMTEGLPATSTVLALTSIDGALYAGGELDEFQGGFVSHFMGASDARGDFGVWESLGKGMTIGCCNIDTVPPAQSVNALADYNGDLIAGGVFDTADATAANNIARWNSDAKGGAWLPVGIPTDGLNWRATAITVYNGALVMGGWFTRAGDADVNFIAKWNGSNWEPLGTGMNARVRALTVHNGDLIAGGDFTSADGEVANRVARWDGASWHPIGTGFNNGVWALHVHNAQLVAGGLFTTADGLTANRIARWDGTAWKPFINSNGTNGIGSTTVYSLGTFNNELVVGGSFNTAGGFLVNNLAGWNGTSWHPFPTSGAPGIAGSIFAITTYNGNLIVGGQFTATMGGATMNRIARWTGSAWQSLAGGIAAPLSATVQSLASFNGELIVGGNLDQTTIPSSPNILRWNGSAWLGAGSGANDDVYALQLHDGKLFVAGDFSVAGGEAAWHWSALEAPTPGDINCSGAVDVDDLLAVINAWGACDDPDDCPADIAPPPPPTQGNDIVDVDDLLMVINNWG